MHTVPVLAIINIHLTTAMICSKSDLDSSQLLEDLSLHVHWNLSWETTAMRDHLSLTDGAFSAEGPTFQYNETCHQRPPVLIDHSFVANSMVFQDRFYCITCCHCVSDREQYTAPVTQLSLSPVLGPETTRYSELAHRHRYLCQATVALLRSVGTCLGSLVCLCWF